MRTVLFLLLVSISVAPAFSQGTYECLISSFTTRTDKASLERFETQSPTQLGKMRFDTPTEGTTDESTLRIPGTTNLYAYVEIFFDDNMNHYGILNDAMTISIAITKGKKRSPSTIVSMSQASSTLAGFRQLETHAVAVEMSQRKLVNVQVLCRMPTQQN